MNAAHNSGLSERVVYRDNGDEISRLSSIFNAMMEELERSFHRQRRFVEDASHEFRTPIAIIEGHLKLLHRWGKEDPAVLEESISAALQETIRLRKLADQLLELSEEEDSKPDVRSGVKAIDPAVVLAAVTTNYRMLHPEFTFATDWEAGLQIRVDPHHLEQILIILTDNAIHYSGKDKSVFITLDSLADQIQIHVEDRGLGIPQGDLPYVFERFYRVDSARGRKRGGAGLGLAIAKRITEAYGGKVRLTSEVGQGTVATVTFKRA